VTHRVNILCSFEYLRKLEGLHTVALGLSDVVNILVDSGAFSIFMAKGKKAEPFTLQDYIKACQESYHGRVWEYIQLDVIGDAAATETNLQEMVRAGLTPMPVFVMARNDFQDAERLAELNPRSRICVAGGVGTKYDYICQRYQKVYAGSGGKAQIHGLGFVRFPQMFQVPIASVDCSSYITGARYGVFQIFDLEKVRRSKDGDGSPFTGLVRDKVRRYLTRYTNGDRKPELLSILQRCREVGLTTDVLADDQHWKGQNSLASLATCAAHLQFSRYCDTQNRRYFLAVANHLFFHNILACLETLRGTSFDYMQARAAHARWEQLYKTDRAEYLCRARETFAKGIQ
jgi:hypothetical protein